MEDQHTSYLPNVKPFTHVGHLQEYICFYFSNKFLVVSLRYENTQSLHVHSKYLQLQHKQFVSTISSLVLFASLQRFMIIEPKPRDCKKKPISPKFPRHTVNKGKDGQHTENNQNKTTYTLIVTYERLLTLTNKLYYLGIL